MSAFDFQHPAAFLLLLFIPAKLLLRKIGVFCDISLPVTLSDWGGKPPVWNHFGHRLLSLVSSVFFASGYIALVAALCDPVLCREKRVYTSRGADVFFVLDTSPSMAAKDMAGARRIDAARSAVHSIVEKNDGASFGLAAMSSEAAVMVPLTLDHKMFFERLDSLVLGDLGTGSAIGNGLAAAVYHLSYSSAPKKCIVLITDGENNAGSIHPETAAELSSSFGISLYILGLGYSGAAPLEYTDPVTGKVYSGFFESNFDAHAMERIASVGNGRYFSVQNMPDLLSALNIIGMHENAFQKYRTDIIYKHCYRVFVLLSVLLFFCSWAISRVFMGDVL